MCNEGWLNAACWTWVIRGSMHALRRTKKARIARAWTDLMGLGRFRTLINGPFNCWGTSRLIVVSYGNRFCRLRFVSIGWTRLNEHEDKRIGISQSLNLLPSLLLCVQIYHFLPCKPTSWILTSDLPPKCTRSWWIPRTSPSWKNSHAAS